MNNLAALPVVLPVVIALALVGLVTGIWLRRDISHEPELHQGVNSL